MTPKQASKEPRGRMALEALLRDFEYRSDRARLAGATGRDIGALRAELGMEAG